jgi:hypothetical protein
MLCRLSGHDLRDISRDVPPSALAMSWPTHLMHAGGSSGRLDRLGGLYPFRVGVTMSMHKLTAGSGYDYLTRQVAALDATEKGHIGLASYYTERGESPGVWIGSGLDGIDGLAGGDPVTAEQMRALFGCGLHPLAELRQQQLEGPTSPYGTFRMRRGWGRRSRSSTTI